MEGEERSAKRARAPGGVGAALRRWWAEGRSPVTDGAPWIGPALSWLRGVIVVTMLLIVVAWPVPARTGYVLWPIVLAFAAYNLLVELARRASPRLRSFGWVPLLDLPVSGTLYFLDAEPGGPLFVAFYLAVVTAATCWPLGRTLLYLAAVATLVVVIAPTLPQWEATPGQIRQLASRLVILALVGVGTAFLTRRLAHQAETARSMRDEAERLEALDHLRAAFVASVSHDLRTPLTAAQAGLGFLTAGAGERLAPEERDLLVSVRRSVDRLGTLIEDLLTSVQIEGGVLNLEREPVDLRDVVADAVATIHPLLRQKGQLLEVDLPEALPVLGDARRLSQVVVNLLANANGHTPAGTRVALDGRRDREVRLCVRDDGPSIPAGERERVFERFYRLGAGGTSGLGLSNARSIVEGHGGRIWIEDAAGRGATVCLALPSAPRRSAP